MSQDYWQQQGDEPLFPNLLWSRPETRQGAGKLLIIGGQAEAFIHVAESYAAAEEAKAGTIRVMMPESTRSITGILPNIEYAPSNSSGSFSKQALGPLIEASQWADGVLLSGDLGRNSETCLMLEAFTAKYAGTLIVSSAATGSLTIPAADFFSRASTMVLLSYSQLQKIITELKFSKPLTSTLDKSGVAAILHELTRDMRINLVLKAKDSIWTSYGGRVASTVLREDTNLARISSAAAVWWLQNPPKPFEAATSAIYCLR
jgi:hypothetical protein